MRVLIIAPSIEPDKSVGAIRMSCLTRYLVENGIDVYILTNKKLNDVVLVEPSHVEYVNIIAELSNKSNLDVFNENKKLYKKSYEKIISNNNIDITIISGGPFFTFNLSVDLKRKNIPCVLDFRDPWFFDIRENNKTHSIKNLIRRCYLYILESRAIRHATAIVTVTDIWKGLFERYYPFQKNKFHLIENGYDDRLLDLVQFSDSTFETFTIGVFGKLFYYTQNYSSIFLQAIQKVGEININQVGERECDTDLLLKKHNLPLNVINSTGFMNYTDGIKELKKSHLFLIIDAREGALGTKIYDYIYLNKPIVYIGPTNTALSNLIKQFENGFVCSEVEEVVEAIEIVRKKGLKQLTTRKTDSYARSYQNQKWMNLLESLHCKND